MSCALLAMEIYILRPSKNKREDGGEFFGWRLVAWPDVLWPTRIFHIYYKFIIPLSIGHRINKRKMSVPNEKY